MKDSGIKYNEDMRKVESRQKSTLSFHVWDLKDSGIHFEVSCKIMERSPAYNSTTKKARICLKEKLHILYKREGATLNRRGEIFNSCRHRNKNFLSTMWRLKFLIFLFLFPAIYVKNVYSWLLLQTVIWKKIVELQLFKDKVIYRLAYSFECSSYLKSTFIMFLNIEVQKSYLLDQIWGNDI